MLKCVYELLNVHKLLISEFYGIWIMAGSVTIQFFLLVAKRGTATYMKKCDPEMFFLIDQFNKNILEKQHKLHTTFSFMIWVTWLFNMFGLKESFWTVSCYFTSALQCQLSLCALYCISVVLAAWQKSFCSLAFSGFLTGSDHIPDCRFKGHVTPAPISQIVTHTEIAMIGVYSISVNL